MKEAKSNEHVNEFHRIRSRKYVTIDNDFLKDKELSCKAKGVLAMILALPDWWKFSIKGMLSVIKEGESALRASINELKILGYCVVQPIRVNGKIARWRYFFAGEKISDELLCDFLKVENLKVENQAQYNNNNEIDRSTSTPINKEKIKKTTKVEKNNEDIEFENYMREHYPYIMKMDKPITREQATKLKDLYGEDVVLEVFDGMNNYKRLTTQYRSAYQTANNWCTRRIQKKPTNE